MAWRLANLQQVLTRRIGFRFLAVHLLVLFLPVGGLILFDRYEQQLLRQQELAMAQQARLFAAALMPRSTTNDIEAANEPHSLRDRANAAVATFAGQNVSRIRVLDANGQLVADTSAAQASVIGEDSASPEVRSGDPTGPRQTESPIRDRLLYRIGAFPFRFVRSLVEPDVRKYRVDTPPFQHREEVRTALNGGYGAMARTDGNRLLLHVAVPIRTGTNPRDAQPVVGAVLVSRSTDNVRSLVYSLRLFLFKIFLASVGLSVIVNLLLATTIERPLRRLRSEAAQILDRRGRVRGEFSSSHRSDEIGDLTRALRGMAASLRQQQQRTEEFVADLSHELKNPLAALRTTLELQGTATEASEASNAVAQRNISRMEHLISDLAELSRIEAGVAAMPTQINASTVIADTATAWAHLHNRLVNITIATPQRMCTITTDPGRHAAVGQPENVAATACTISADPDHVVRILQNLLDNAAAHADSEMPIEVRLTQPSSGSSFLRLTVRDRGCGIAPGDEERVFQRFYSRQRGRSVSTGPDQLAPQGLGLAVVRALANAYDGSAKARTLSDNEGGGALFEVILRSRDL